MKNTITVIIPTLTNTEGLLYLLNYLIDYPIIVVDNAPTRKKENTRSSSGNCRYLPQKINQGFARAINLAATHIKTPWMLILNDDIEFQHADTLEQMISVANTKQWVAISPILQSPKGRTENLGYRILPHGRVELNYDQACHELDGITAACLLIKTSVFMKLGGFDGRFFAYLEDVDLFLRLKRTGYHFGVAKQIKVIHNHMTTSGGMNNFKSKMDLKNWLFVIAKNWSFRELVLHFPGIVLERLRNFSGFAKATWKSYGWRSLYFFPYHLLWIIKELLIFPFRSSSILDKLS